MHNVLAAVSSVISIVVLTIGGAAAQDRSAGAQIVHRGVTPGVVACVICHGMRLQGNAAIGAPALAGAPQAQTLSALAAIAAGRIGTNNVMRDEAHSLTPAQRKAIADYLRSLTKNSIALRRIIAQNGPKKPGIVQISMGANIDQFGTSTGVKPCTACHGRILQGSAAAGAPAIAGEPMSKTLASLNAMAAARTGKNDVMYEIARLLTPEQRKAVAAFVALVTPIKQRSGSTAYHGGRVRSAPSAAVLLRVK